MCDKRPTFAYGGHEAVCDALQTTKLLRKEGVLGRWLARDLFHLRRVVQSHTDSEQVYVIVPTLVRFRYRQPILDVADTVYE